MREAKEWEVNEEEDMRQVLSQYQCNKGIVRIERLGRRKPQHKGGGRFVLAEYQDEHVPALMANKLALERKGIAVRKAKDGFRYPPKRPRRSSIARAAMYSARDGFGSAVQSRRVSLTVPGMEAQVQQGGQEDQKQSVGQEEQKQNEGKKLCLAFQRGKCDVEGCADEHVRICFDYSEGRACRFGDEAGNGCRFAHRRWDGSKWRQASAWNKDRGAGRVPPGFGDRRRDQGGGGEYISTWVWPSGHGRGSSA